MAQTKKDYFTLNQGLNTEANEINFPDGYTTDEQNYELLVDGGRRRRRGLQIESGGASLATGQTIGTGHSVNTHKWRSAAGNPANNFIVHQIGAILHFAPDDDTPSDAWHARTIDLEAFAQDGTTTTAVIEDEPCQFSVGRGVLLVTQKYLKPFYVTYEAASDNFGATPIQISIRDFYGIEDGVANQVKPAALSADHEYNLRNRGWPRADIAGVANAFFEQEGVYPAKNMVWHKGYRRQTDVLYSDLDGIQTFNSEKLVSEQFGQSSAAQGGLFLDPLDTRYSATTTNEGDEVALSSFTFVSGNPKAGGVVKITTASAHGRSNDDWVTISGTTYVGTGFDLFVVMTFDGYRQITVVDGDEFTFVLPPKSGVNSATETFLNSGQLNGNVSLPKSDGELLSVGPTAVAFHAGRGWYAGIQSKVYNDVVFFSKLALEPATLGVCYQEADPTNPDENMLSSSDGGHIIVPGLGKVNRMLSLRDSLLIFSDQGLWEIAAPSRGVFTAGTYSVRKISEAESSSPRSPLVMGNRALYTGPRGIHLVTPNQFTSLLEEDSVSDKLVQTLWNDIPQVNQKNVYTAYDEALDRVYFLYGLAATTNANIYQYALVLDLKVGAYFKYKFNESATEGILGVYSVTDADSTNSNKKIKFVVQSTNSVNICDLNSSTYLDFDGAESPLPFFTTGWDNIGDFQRRRQAPVITVFAKRTETGYTQTGNGWDGDNESSNLLTAYWDWTNDSVSGKDGAFYPDGSAKSAVQRETYRHPRAFVPSAANDVDGYPVVTTRNKIRGRGRVLQLRFDGAATKDSHILGFTTNYRVEDKV